MLTAGFEPAHANITGPKPVALDHSAKSTVFNLIFLKNMPTVRFELTWGFRPVDLESTPIDQATGSRHCLIFIVLLLAASGIEPLTSRL